MNNNVKISKNELNSVYQQVDTVVEKSFLNYIEKYEIVSVLNQLEARDIKKHIRLRKIDKIVFDEDEDILDKLTTVYATVHSLEGDMVMILHSDGKSVEFYLGVKLDDQNSITNVSSGFEQAFNGNFPGCSSTLLKNSQTDELLSNKVFSNPKLAVSVANGIPSLKDEDKERFTQGLEKFIESMQGKKYSAILIANALSNADIFQRRSAYERIYSSLVPFSAHDLTFGNNESQAVTEGISKSFTHTASESLTKTTSHTEGKNSGVSKSSTHTGGVMGGIMTPFGGFGANYSYSKGKTETIGTSSSDTEGKSEQQGTSEAQTDGTNSSDTKTQGISQTYQLKYENKTVKNFLEKMDRQIERMDESEDYGMYDFAAYFISEDYKSAQVAASTYRAVMRGKNSSVEKSSIASWKIDDASKKIIPYLKKLEHPIIEIDEKLRVTPTSLISSKELALAMDLPRKAVKGVVVTKSAEFARDIYHLDGERNINDLALGSVYHLGKVENETKISLDLHSLSMHTLITGATGSGKSNTIYNLIDKADRKNIKFLIIEPAKGEYKDVLGGRDDVSVYGSNSKYARMLRINPFRFHDEIHILEHIDRVIEIFNACWPMYAAMPAVLKDAVIRSYVACGWDIDESVCIGKTTYPSFDLLLHTLEEVIESSQYADEMKSNYKGALLTRVKSLTNGLLGQIFNGENSIEDAKLFDENVIIDLSRIGSMESKSLIMGMLVLKLMEYRYATKDGRNSKLKHLTVLEEAHNLLKRVSTEQSSESDNLQGKAVEMLSNAIAEMRTYGEGFIIADQSPNMLDMSAIRNTGTKIIMRLPELTDRNDVGKSAALTEEQIDELPKLSTGVAVVYQNNWLEAVLCKIDKFEDAQPYHYEQNGKIGLGRDKIILGDMLKILLYERLDPITQKEADCLDKKELLSKIDESAVSDGIKEYLKEVLVDNEKLSDLHKEESFPRLAEVVSSLVDGKKILSLSKSANSLEMYNERLGEIIRHYVETSDSEALETAIKQALSSHEARETSNFGNLYYKWVELQEKNSEGIV